MLFRACARAWHVGISLSGRVEQFLSTPMKKFIWVPGSTQIMRAGRATLRSRLSGAKSMMGSGSSPSSMSRV